MKIAVTSQNRHSVTEHAGKCRKFWIYDVAGGEIQGKRLLELPKAQSFHDSARTEPHPLNTVDVLISGGMGRGLERRLRERGIEAIVTHETDPDVATKAYLDGTLVRLPAGCETHPH
ncbi:MAG: NifB/NifX family molybdenum-iron cluster-binding protein [Gammaproteobacteria bacterium]